MLKSKIFLVKTGEEIDFFASNSDSITVELTPKFEAQLLSKELVLRKIEGLKVCLKKAEEVKEYKEKWSVVGEFKAQIEVLKEILNECSIKENSLDEIGDSK